MLAAFCLTVFVSVVVHQRVGLDMVHCRSAFGKWKHAMKSWERGFGRRPSGACPLPPPPPPPFCGEEKLEPTQATACNIGFCNIKRRWEDIGDSEEFPFAPQADFFLLEIPRMMKERILMWTLLFLRHM